MKRIFFMPIIASIAIILSLFSAYALSSQDFSFNGNGKNIADIGSCSLSSSKTQFSVWHSKELQGKGIIRISAECTNGDKITLNLNFKESYFNYISPGIFSSSGEASGNYRATGFGPVKIEEIITYAYNSNTKLMEIVGSGDISFNVDDLSGKIIYKTRH